MPVVLWFQSTGSVPGNGDPVHMQGSSLTIGRGPENDLVLPDPDRVMSKRHCAIEDHNGNVVVVDMSTNGTFLNYGKLPLGPTPTPLNDGDILIVGPYELLVNVAAEGQQDHLAAPISDAPVSPGVAELAPSANDLLEAPGDGGDFLDDLLSGRDGPVGPGGVEREELGDDGLLPPLDAEDALLPPAEAEDLQGASMGMHAPAGQDQFSVPQVADSAIPDDWDAEFANPAPAASPADPFSKPAPDTTGGGAAFIPDDFEAGTFGAPTPPPVAPPQPVQAAAPAPSEAATTPPVHEPPAVQAPVTAPPAAAPVQVSPVQAAPAAGGADAAARAFLKSLGAEDVHVSDQELTSTMSRMGHVLRVMITGMREILMTRTSIKSEFRIKQTVLKTGGNNPLKFSISPEQAVEAMVRPKAKGYLDAIDATEESLRDIKAHEVAMIAGMEAAIQGVLGKLAPEKLEEMIAGGSSLNLLKSKGTRYWEIYKTKYAEISDKAESEFYELFAHEFARAYQEQLDKLK